MGGAGCGDGGEGVVGDTGVGAGFHEVVGGVVVGCRGPGDFDVSAAKVGGEAVNHRNRRTGSDDERQGGAGGGQGAHAVRLGGDAVGRDARWHRRVGGCGGRSGHGGGRHPASEGETLDDVVLGVVTRRGDPSDIHGVGSGVGGYARGGLEGCVGAHQGGWSAQERRSGVGALFTDDPVFVDVVLHPRVEVHHEVLGGGRREHLDVVEEPPHAAVAAALESERLHVVVGAPGNRDRDLAGGGRMGGAADRLGWCVGVERVGAVPHQVVDVHAVALCVLTGEPHTIVGAYMGGPCSGGAVHVGCVLGVEVAGVGVDGEDRPHVVVLVVDGVAHLTPAVAGGEEHAVGNGEGLDVAAGIAGRRTVLVGLVDAHHVEVARVGDQQVVGLTAPEDLVANGLDVGDVLEVGVGRVGEPVPKDLPHARGELSIGGV